MVLALSAAMPLSPAAPVHLDEVFAGVLLVEAVVTLARSRRVGDAVLLAEAAGGIVITAALVGAAATSGGTFLSCAGFLWVALWVAAFFSPRTLALAVGVELAGALAGALLNRDPLRALGAACSIVAVSGITAAVLAHVVGGLRRQARYDQLTGLLNRYGIDQALGDLEWRRRATSP